MTGDIPPPCDLDEYTPGSIVSYSEFIDSDSSKYSVYKIVGYDAMFDNLPTIFYWQ